MIHVLCITFLLSSNWNRDFYHPFEKIHSELVEAIKSCYKSFLLWNQFKYFIFNFLWYYLILRFISIWNILNWISNNKFFSTYLRWSLNSWCDFISFFALISGKPQILWNKYFGFYQDGEDIVGTFHLIRLEVLLHPLCWGIANS